MTDPELLDNNKAVYYEVLIEKLGMYTKKNGAVQSHVCIGWATAPYVRHSTFYCAFVMLFISHILCRHCCPSPHAVRVVLVVAWFRYPPFEEVGKATHSLGLNIDGRVVCSRANILAENTMLYPEGIDEGDVVGAGYELRRDAGVLEFFFTVNGTRLPPLPNDWGLFELSKAKKCVFVGCDTCIVTVSMLCVYWDDTSNI